MDTVHLNHGFRHRKHALRRFFAPGLIGAFLFCIFAFPSIASAAIRSWDGGGVDNNWSTCANWSADTCPLTTDEVLFDATSSKSVTVDTNITVVNFTMNSGYGGTLTSGSNTMTVTGNFVQGGGVFNLSSATTTLKGNVTITGGNLIHNSGLTFLSVQTFTTYTLTLSTSTFYNVTFDNSNGGGGSAIYALASNMTIAGNLVLQDPNSGNFTIRSDTSGTARTITVAGNMSDAVTAQTGGLFIGNTADTFRVIFDIKGNLTLSDNNTILYADMIFSSSSAQTITKSSTNTLINSLSDWFDTGSGNFVLGSNVVGSMTFNTDDSSDFTFASTAFTLSLANASITPATSYSPSGALTTTFTNLNLVPGTGTFNATGSTTFAVFNMSGGTFNAASNGTTTLTNNFTYTGGTFNHNNGTMYFTTTSAVGTSNTITPNGAVFGNVTFDYPVSVGANTLTLLASDMTIAGNLTVQNTNLSGGGMTLQSSVSTTTRNISVGGNLTFPLTSAGMSGLQNIGVSGGTSNIAIDLKGNFYMDDTGSNLYGDLNFSSSSTQTITKLGSGTISSFSDWTDTGSGNLALTANFSGSMNLIPDTSTDFNFVATSFTFTAGSVAVTPATTFSPAGPSSYIITTANLTTGTFNASVASTSFGTLTINGGTLNAGAGTTTITAGFLYTSGTFNHNNGTIAFLNPSAGAIVATSSSAVFNNVFFDYPSSSGVNTTTSLTSDMIVNGSFIVQNSNTSGGGLTVQSNISGTTRNVSVGGDLIFASTSQTSVPNIGVSGGTSNIAFDLKGNFLMLDAQANLYADVAFSSSSAQTLTKTGGTISSFSDWTDTGSGNLALTANFSGSMSLVTDGATDFNFVATPFTFTVGSATVTPATIFNPEGPSSYIFTTLNLPSGTFTASAASTSIATLLINGGTFNAGTGTTTVTSSFTYSSGTFNHNDGIMLFSAPSAGTVTITPGAANFGTVSFDYPVNTGANGIASLAGDMTVAGSLILRNTNAVAAGFTIQSNLSGTPRTITVAGDYLVPATSQTGSVAIGVATTNKINVNVAGNVTLADSSLTSYASTTLNGTSTQILTKTAGTIIAGLFVDKISGQAVLGNALALSSAPITVASGTLKTAGYGISGSNVVVSGPGTLLMQGTETLSATPTLAVSSTVTYEGSSTAATTIKAYPYSNLTVQAGSNTLVLLATTTVSGNMNIISGTLDASSTRSYGLNVAGDWYNTGTFVPRNGTVSLNGTNQAIYGTTTFYNLTKTVASAATLTFATTTQTITNTWNMSGASGNLLSFRSSAPGTQWRINPQGTRTLSYVDVQDSNNINASAVNIDGTMVNSGNNTNWSFDSIPPTATLTSTSTGTSTAIINWTTDEPATSTVQYGLTTGYGSQATSSGTTTHTVSLSGLSEGTLYHFRFFSTDAAGNSTSTSDMTFTTADASAPTVSITSPASSTVRGTVSLAATSTDNIGVVGVKFYLNSTLIGSEDLSSPYTGSLDTTGFADGPYTLRAVARDAANNIATSTGVALTIDNTAPTATTIASTTSTSTASITWGTTEAATSTVQYGLTTSYGSQATSSGTTSHSVALSGLTESTLYHFRITSIDAIGNTSTTTDRTFTTTDGTAPLITGIATSTTHTTATINWNTNEAATSTVQYGTTISYGSQATSSSTSTHTVTLGGLSPSTTYHYQITARDASGNVTNTSDAIFVTSAAPDTTAPTITSVNATPGTSTASFTWNTNEAATSTVRYGLTASYGLQATSSGTTSHSVALSGLSDGTLYHYQVTARDAAGNASSTADLTFTTIDATAPILSNFSTSTSYATATIGWDTNEPANTAVYYGTSPGTYAFSSTSVALLSNHAVALSGLSASTTYYYRMVSADAVGNTATSTERTFVTLAIPDMSIPTVAITAPTAGSYAGTVPLAATSTDDIAVIGVKFYLNATLIGSEDLSAPYTESLDTTGFADGAHSLVAVARDGAGNVATSSSVSIAIDNTAPIISSISATPSDMTALISWGLNESATSSVEYGLTTSYGSVVVSDTLTNTPVITLNSLTASTTYHYRVTSRDPLGNISTSTDATFITSATPVVITPPEVEPQGPVVMPGVPTGKFVVGFTPNESPAFILANNRNQQNQPVPPADGHVNLLKLVPNIDLALGAKGVQVKNLQIILNALGFRIANAGAGSPGNETELFGPATKAALLRFQKAHNVKGANGNFGPATRAKLKAILQ